MEQKCVQKAILIVNTFSRNGEKFIFEAVDELTALGLELVATLPVRDLSRLPEVVREAINSGIGLIVIGGGDGTFSSVVDYFAHHDVVLGVLPFGTGNDFARSLGIPLDLKDACRTIVTGRIARIDLGLVNNDYFVSTIGIGINSEVSRYISRSLKRRWGRLAYFLVAAKLFWRHRPFQVKIKSLEEEFTLTTHQVVVSNGRYHGGGIPVAPQASLNNYQLVVYTIEGISRWHLLKMAFWVKTGQHYRHKETHYLTTRKVTLETEKPMAVSVDGESIFYTPVTVVIDPAALRVIVPGDYN